MQHKFLAGGLLVAALTVAAGIAQLEQLDDHLYACLEGTTLCEQLDDYLYACLEGTTDCDDTGILYGPDEPVGDVFDNRVAVTHGTALLGLSETELDLNNRVDVRIGRRGEEQMALTEDYHLGRMTVQLDINDVGEWMVTAVTVELIDGPQTFTRHLT